MGTKKVKKTARTDQRNPDWEWGGVRKGEVNGKPFHAAGGFLFL